MGTMWEDYQELDYKRSSSGLFLPVGKWKDIDEVLTYGESLGKAERTGGRSGSSITRGHGLNGATTITIRS